MKQEIPILSIIPQRPPFVMVDTLLFADEHGARTQFTVRSDNPLVSQGCFREPGLVENIAQTAAARAGFQCITEQKIPQTGYIGDVKNLDIVELPVVGDVLETEIRIENQIFDITVISGKVYCNKKLMAQCEMKIFITNQKSSSS